MKRSLTAPSKKQAPAPAAKIAKVEKAKPAEKPQTPAPKTASIVPVEKPGPITNVDAARGNGIEGEVDRSDLQFPNLKLVQSIGPLSENFEPGVYVLNGETPLTNPDGTINITVVSMKIQYIENLAWGSEETPRIFDTIEEVRAVGGYTEWIDNKKPPFSKFATAMVVIEMPKELGESVLFPFERDGKHYGAAIWTMRNTAYTKAATRIITAAETGLKKLGLNYGHWQLGQKRAKAGDNLVHQPVLTSLGIHDQDTANFMMEVING